MHLDRARGLQRRGFWGSRLVEVIAAFQAAYGHGVGRGGMTNPSEIKAIAGNSASCLGFSIALFTGSIPAASTLV